MRLWKKITVGVVTLCVGAPLLLVGAANAFAWYSRWRTGQFILVMKTVRPGITTQADYLRMVRPFANIATSVGNGDGGIAGEVAICNRSELIQNLLNTPVGVLDNALSGRAVPPGMMFWVLPTYEGGIVTQLHIRYYVGVSGHAPGAFVTWSASRYEGGDGGEFPGYFKGYQLSKVGLEKEPPWEYFVTMDERATSEESSRALDFQLQCLTGLKWCMEAREYLQPAPDRPTPDSLQ